MSYLNDDVLDDGIQVLTDNVNALYICSQEPTTRTEAVTTYALGTKASPTVAAPADGSPDGRSVTVSAVTDGTVSGSGDATHYALVDGTRLLAAGALNATVAITSGNTFTLTAFTVRIPDPA